MLYNPPFVGVCKFDFDNNLYIMYIRKGKVNISCNLKYINPKVV